MMKQFQSPDGMLPGDDAALAELSGKKRLWPKIRPEVMAHFEAGPSGKVYDPRLYREWVRSRDLYSKKVSGGKQRWNREESSRSPQGVHEHIPVPIPIPVTKPKATTLAPSDEKPSLDTAASPPLSQASGLDIRPQKPNATASPAASGDASPVFLSLPLNDGSLHAITEANVAHWSVLYPSVDVRQEIRKMAGWCESNPRNRKTRGGIGRFITGWLAREQDKFHPSLAAAPRWEAPRPRTPVSETRYEPRPLYDENENAIFRSMSAELAAGKPFTPDLARNIRQWEKWAQTPKGQA